MKNDIESFGTIKWKKTYNFLSVSFIGELTDHSFKEFSHECTKICKTIDKVFINTEKMLYIDSSGIGQLIRIRKLFKEIYICSMPKFLKHLFELMNLNNFFKIYENKYQVLEILFQDVPLVTGNKSFYNIELSTVNIIFPSIILNFSNTEKILSFIKRSQSLYNILDMRFCNKLDDRSIELFKKIAETSDNLYFCKINKNIHNHINKKKLNIDRIFDNIANTLKNIEKIQQNNISDPRKTTVEKNDDFCIFHIGKIFDNQTTVKYINPLLTKKIKTIILDLKNLKDNSQEILIQILLLYKKFSKDLAIYNVNEELLNVLKNSGFDSFINILYSKEELNSFINSRNNNTKIKTKLKEGKFEILMRNNGYSLTVYPPNQFQKPVVNEMVFRELREKEIKFEDKTVIQHIIDDAEGIPYKIDKSSLNISRVNIEITQDFMEAYIWIKDSSYNEELFPDLDDIAYALKKNNVRYGIFFEKLKKIAANKITDEKILIAKGKLPKHAVSEQVTFFINTKPKAKPSHLIDGSVNFYDLNIIENIKKDQLLFERIPFQKECDGFMVNSATIRAQTASNKELRFGDNIYFSSDNRKAFSKVDGHLFYKNNFIDVHSVLTIKGDVDFNTGNINYNGNIYVKGNLKAGFKIESKGRVQIDGVVDGGSIYADNEIVIKKGIFGHKKTHIETKNNLICQSIQESEIIVGNDLVVNGAILHCNIIVDNSVFLIEDRASFIGGSLVAGNNICLSSAGSPLQVSTLVSIDNVSRIYIEKKKNILKKEIEEENNNIEDIVELFKDMSYAEEQFKRTKNKKLFVNKICQFHKQKDILEQKKDMWNFYNSILKSSNKELKEILDDIRNDIVNNIEQINNIKDIAEKYIENINRNSGLLSKKDINTIENYHNLEKNNNILNYKFEIIESLIEKSDLSRKKIKIVKDCNSGVIIKMGTSIKNILKTQKSCSFVYDKKIIKVINN